MRTLFTFGIVLTVWLLSNPLPASQPSGVVVAWGEDYYGGGDRGATNVVIIGGQQLTNAVAIAAGGLHSLALTADGTVVGWGANAQGEAVGYPSPERHRGGRVEMGGRPLEGIMEVAAGRATAYSFSLALRSNGTIVAWGEGSRGETAVPAGLTNVTAVSAGSLQGLALKADGTVVSWGWGKPPPPGLSNVVAISAAGQFGRNLALTGDGHVVDWPVHASGVYDSQVPEGLSNVVAVSAGWNHSLALRSDGTVVGWGHNNTGQATGTINTTFAMGSTGLVSVAGLALSNVVAIAAAHDFSLALKKDGTIVSWGRSLGVSVPEGLSNVVAISAGDYYCLAITTNRQVAGRFTGAR